MAMRGQLGRLSSLHLDSGGSRYFAIVNEYVLETVLMPDGAAGSRDTKAVLMRMPMSAVMFGT